MRLLFIAAVMLAGFPSWIWGVEEEPLPADLQISLLLKVLTYDRALKDRCPKSVEIGILYVEGNKESESSKNRVLQVVRSLGDRPTVKQIPFNFKTIKWTSKEALQKAVVKKKIRNLYVTPGHAAHITAITAISHEEKILTISGVPAYADSGLGVVLTIKDQRPRTLVNLLAAKAVGADIEISKLDSKRIDP